MSQPATEAPAAPPAAGQSGGGGVGGALKRKLGPLPVWGWIAVIGGAIVLYYLYKSRTSSATEGATTSAAQVPQFVNQTYTTVTPPSTPTGGTSSGGGTSTGGGSSGVPLKKEKGGKVRVGSVADLYEIAKKLGVSESALAAANPSVKKYVGTGKGIPAGTILKVPKNPKKIDTSKT